MYPRASVQSWCERCVFNDGRVDELTIASLVEGNIAAMGLFDWVALVLSTVVVALSIGGELKVRERRRGTCTIMPRVQLSYSIH